MGGGTIINLKTMVYLDASFIAPLFIAEDTSDDVEHYLQHLGEDLSTPLSGVWVIFPLLILGTSWVSPKVLP
jgi:hypothetical protein